MFTKINLIYVFLIFNLALAENDLYTGYKVYNVTFNKIEQEEKFSLIINENIDYWRRPSFKRGVSGLAMVPPSYLDWFEGRLGLLDIDKQVYIEDVKDYLKQKEATSETVSRSEGDSSRIFDYNSYSRYNEILSHLNTLQQTYSESTTVNLELIEYGYTFQNRPLVYLRLTSRIESANKQVIVIEAGMNPREWITISAALYSVDRLLEEQQTNLLNNYEWIIIPTLNPDGYEYSFTDRLWRKTLTESSDLGFICPGVNLNRNFDVSWSVSDTSTSPCSPLYGGVESFSEIESQMIRSILNEYGTRVKAYFSLQNNGGMISYPWMYEFAASGMFVQQHFLGLDMVNAAQTNYNLGVGSSSYNQRISGTSVDYAQNNGVLYSYLFDIVQGDDGVIIPETDIVEIVEGVWRAINVAASNLI